MTMTKRAKWITFWLLSAGFACGIFVICAMVTVVNYMGSETFCSTFCHSMNGVAYAWKQGTHARTASGKTAGCSDCHLYNASENTLGPIGYISLLGHKAVAGSHSLWGQIIGHFSTPQDWLDQRPGIEANEKQWFVSTNFHTCRGCHDLSLMWTAKNPSIGAWHAMYQNQPLDCLSCHKQVGHNYTQVDAYIKAHGTYPPLEEAWANVNAAPSDVSGASPMPPLNPTAAQLKADSGSSATATKPATSSQTNGASGASKSSTTSSQAAPATSSQTNGTSAASKSTPAPTQAAPATNTSATQKPLTPTQKVEKEALQLNKEIGQPFPKAAQ